MNAWFDIVYTFLFVKYYTDIDTEWVQEVEDFHKLYDYCALNGICDTCTPENAKDADSLREYWWRYSTAVIELYAKQHSLEQMVKSFLATDTSAENAETRELVEKLIDLKNGYLDRGEQPVKNVGGGILSFAKKK